MPRSTMPKPQAEADEIEGSRGLLHAMLGVAGVAGCGIAALIVVFRDIVRANFLAALSPQHSAAIIGAIVAATFFTAIIAIYVWLAKHPSKAITDRAYVFLGLVITLVGAGLAAIWILAKPMQTAAPSALDLGRQNLAEGDLTAATRQFQAALREAPNDPAPPYWIARTALRRGEYEVGRRYLDVALARDPLYEPALMGTVVLAVVDNNTAEVVDLAALKLPPTPSMTNWTSCLERHGMLNGAYFTLTRVTDACPITED